MKALVKTNILGVGITNATPSDVLEYIVAFIEKSTKKMYIVTPNPEILVHATKNTPFRQILNNADIALNDGVGVTIAARILGQPLKSRLTGVDLLEMLCKEVSNRPITVGFLGAKGRVAEMTAECLASRCPNLKIVFAAPEWGEEGFDLASRLELRIKNKELRLQSKEKSHNSQFIIPNSVDILFVAYGFPKQEQWMADNLGSGKFRVAMGVGGAFDYISGQVPRAPSFIRHMGFEWLFRLVVQPWRLKRQLALVEFVWLVVKEKFR